MSKRSQHKAPGAVDTLALLAGFQQTIARLESTNAQLVEEIAELRRLLFGPSKRERMPAMQREVDRAKPKSSAAKDTANTKAKRKKSRDAKKSLPEVILDHDFDVCPCCGGTDLKDIGAAEESRECELEAARIVSILHRRHKKKCGGCKALVTAPSPAKVVDGAQYGPKLHAHVVVQKTIDSMPLYRQSKAFGRHGLKISDSTLGEIFHRCAELCEPLARRIYELVKQSNYVNADETTLRVQAKERCDKSFVWTFLAPQEKLIAYVMGPGRGAAVAEGFLGGSCGVLQCDDYGGYNSVTTEKGRHRISCLSHIRRYFFKALDSNPEESRWMLNRILEMYIVEREAAELQMAGTAKHLALRLKKSRPIFNKVSRWLAKQKGLHPPKSSFGKAIKYAINNWPRLSKVFENPTIRLDNNLAENALRIIALGRKNFLFVGNKLAGRNLAILQTLTSTCVANEVNPQEYLADVLLRVQSTKASNIDTLLPHLWQPTS